jgi:hypothetical protein
MELHQYLVLPKPRRHLYRSALVPLDVLVNDDLCRQVDEDGPHLLEPSDIDKLLRLLIPHARRSRTLTIQSSFSEVIYQIVGNLHRVSAPLLQHFSIIRDTAIECEEGWQGGDNYSEAAPLS